MIDRIMNINRKIYYAFIFILFFNSAAFSERTLTLDECKSLALTNNAKMKISSLEKEGARKTKGEAFTKYFPQITAGAFGFKANDYLVENPISLPPAFASLMSMPSGFFKKDTVGYINVAQPVYVGGRIYNGNKLAEIGENIYEYMEELSRNEVILQTEVQYWQIISLNEKINTVSAYEEFLTKLLNKVEDSYNAGLVIKNDVLKVKQKRSELLLNRSKLENGKKLAEMAFCQYIGIPYEQGIILNDKLTIDTDPEKIYTDSSIALLNRLEYKLLKKSVEAEELKTKMKLGEYLPAVSVGVAGLSNKIDEWDRKNNYVMYGMVQAPISDWWGASYSLRERKIREKIEESKYKNNKELLLLQMEKAWQDLNDANKQLLLSEESKAQAQDNLNVNTDSYNNGISDLTNLLEAQAAFKQAEDEVIESKMNYKTKQIVYMQTTGRGF